MFSAPTLIVMENRRAKMSEVRFKPGTIFISFGEGFVSKIIRLLTSIRYGIPYRDCASHVSTAYTDDQIGSAEPGGYKIINRKTEQENARVMAYEFVGTLPAESFYLLVQNTIKRRVGVKYAFWRYLLDPQRISMFYLAQLLLITVIGGLIALLFGVSAAVSFIPADAALMMIIASLLLGRIFRGKDAVTMDCAEAEATNHYEMGTMTFSGYGKARNEFPNSIQCHLENLRLYGIVKLVAVKNPHGEWYETAESKISKIAGSN